MPATATKVFPSQFVRRTTLEPDERRINFHQIDHNVIMAITSADAARVTDKMAKIYLRLVGAPTKFQQAPGVLCFPGERRGDEWITGHDQLIEWLGVSPATATKALAWLSENAIIGYSSPKNGHPTRIWLNRAAESIAKKPEAPKANLRLVEPAETVVKTELNAAKKFAPAGSNFSAANSKIEPAFKEEDPKESSIVVTSPAAEPSRVSLATEENAAEQSGAAQPTFAPTFAPTGAPVSVPATTPAPSRLPADSQSATSARTTVCLCASPQPDGPPLETALLATQIGELAVQIARLRSEVAQKPSAGNLLGSVSAAVRAEISDQLNFQFGLTRDWLNNKALPQVARISQSETFKLLRSIGVLKTKEAEKAAAYVGASTSVVSSAASSVVSSVKTGAAASAPPTAAPPSAKPLTEREVLNAAEAVWILADVRQISVEESLQQVLAESWATDERTKAPQYEQALRELVADPTLCRQVRRAL